MDTDGSGELSMREFIGFWEGLRGALPNEKVGCLQWGLRGRRVLAMVNDGRSEWRAQEGHCQ